MRRSTRDWGYEAGPLDREDDWLVDHRFTWDEALRVAVELAPHIVTNIRKASDRP